MNNIEKNLISKAILKSQHCQRNFDLEKVIPSEDLELLKTAISQCPSKQNMAFYKTHFIFDRKIIEEIYETTKAEIVGSNPVRYRKNPQCLGNLLVVFEEADVRGDPNKYHRHKNTETKAVFEGKATIQQIKSLENDRTLAVGIAAGYLNLTASLLGYKTGCCSCFSSPKIQSILNLKNRPLLLMGVGFRDKSRIRTEHHLEKGYFIGVFKKQPVEMNIIGRQEENIMAGNVSHA